MATPYYDGRWFTILLQPVINQDIYTIINMHHMYIDYLRLTAFFNKNTELVTSNSPDIAIP